MSDLTPDSGRRDLRRSPWAENFSSLASHVAESSPRSTRSGSGIFPLYFSPEPHALVRLVDRVTVRILFRWRLPRPWAIFEKPRSNGTAMTPSARDADQDALYTRVAAEFGPPLARLAGAYESDSSRRQDLLQELHFAVWRSLATFRNQCSLVLGSIG